MAVVFIFGIQIACQMTFISLGRAKDSIIVAIVRKFVLVIPLIYILPNIFRADQTNAVYMAEPVADILAVTFTAILFFFEFKKPWQKSPAARRSNPAFDPASDLTVLTRRLNIKQPSCIITKMHGRLFLYLSAILFQFVFILKKFFKTGKQSNVAK